MVDFRSVLKSPKIGKKQLNAACLLRVTVFAILLALSLMHESLQDIQVPGRRNTSILSM